MGEGERLLRVPGRFNPRIVFRFYPRRVSVVSSGGPTMAIRYRGRGRSSTGRGGFPRRRLKLLVGRDQYRVPRGR